MSSTGSVPDFSTYEGFNLGPILTPFFVGTVISLILSGITILQAWTYFPSKDRTFIQIIAACMIMLDLISTGLISQGTWYYLIPRFGSLLPLQSLVPTLGAECTISVVIIFICQSYFVWQILTVSGQRPYQRVICGVIMVFAVTSFIGGMACSIIMVTDKGNILMNRSYQFAVSAGIAKGASSVTDILATATFCWSLDASKTGVKRTDSIIKRLISYIIQRGIVVTAIQTLFLLLFFLTESHTYWLALHVNVTRLYANTFFAMLNGRDNIRAKAQNTYTMTMAISGDTGGTYNQSFNASAGGQDVFNEDNKRIHVDKVVVVDNV
ncbi:hypothetical protein BDP27DRAFT_1336528 [Rhodocollybia butyracea]|uniref:DUF6534 domain-containing protein n=1 Tax=Rhodocollybia butyracea TaxID=206335 RepID=A0A9P5U1L1_9AGAR|nr:hypothetical protein BDP27DRAFT_1336528 [Rhodocollybia butyracea]